VMKKVACCFIIWLSCTIPVLSQQIAVIPGDVLSTLPAQHPYLLLNDAELNRLKEQQNSDAILKKYIGDVLARADKDINLSPLEHKLIGPRLLSVSRECLRRVYSLGLAYRLTGDEKYARACEENLLTVCVFPDWNPSHFLDTAEMSHAVGIGYDWLFNWLSPDSKNKIRDGLIRHGLKNGVKAYNGEDDVPRWWIESYHNWNQVCNCGLIVGALAVADTDPEYARVIIPGAVKSLPRALATYGPDGAWPEGPGYWHYASRYTAYGLSALKSALGTDFGLSKTDGLSETGFFPLYTTGPTGLYVNFADSGERARRSTMPCLFWFARTYHEQFIADQEHETIDRYGVLPEHLVWYVPRTKESYSPDLDKLFKGSVEVAVMRSEWNDSDALFVGFKAGYNQVNHGHLDLGNFELDALGVRWARDLGSDDYNLPDYWGRDKNATRWTYYRLNSFSHNVCTLNGQNQDVMAEAAFVKFHSEPDAAFAIVDLTSAYAPVSTKTTRGVAVVEDRHAVLVQDEFELAGSSEIAWGMTTDADIDTGGSTAQLTLEGKTLTARILSPAGAVFTVESAAQEPPQKTNAGVNRLMLRIKNQSGDVRIAVLFSPHWKDGEIVKDTEVKSLDSWE
ncbi:MAG: heparinase II/III family protein, partial [Candidatus Latescibacteria bacterium]|nr:heparinase II/III family protein [Candidatus Latescibacterota bacterium]